MILPGENMGGFTPEPEPRKFNLFILRGVHHCLNWKNEVSTFILGSDMAFRDFDAPCLFILIGSISKTLTRNLQWSSEETVLYTLPFCRSFFWPNNFGGGIFRCTAAPVKPSMGLGP